jgi:F-box protein, helicase, 18
VLSLYNGRPSSIRDPLVQQMKDLDELEDYIEKTADVQLGMMVEIVKEYGNRVPGLIQTLKEKHTGNEDRSKAEMIFSTVHRCKGMEYDTVQLVGDFVTEATLERLKEDIKKEGPGAIAHWNEEINLLYVAVTRTRSSVRLPDNLVPRDFPPSPLVQLIPTKKEEEKKELPASSKGQSSYQHTYLKTHAHPNSSKPPAKPYTEIRRQYKEAYKLWTKELDNELLQLYRQDRSIAEIARYLDRQPGAIQSRLRRLGVFYEDS